jgi:hypothetical protein
MKKSLVAIRWQQLQQCRRGRLEFYLDDSCDRLKTCRDGYVVIATEKRQRDNSFATIRGGKGPLWGTVFVFLKLSPAACMIPGYEINLRQCHDSWKQAKQSFTTNTSRHVRDS